MLNKAVQAHHGFIEAIQQNIQGSRMCQGHIQKLLGYFFSKVTFPLFFYDLLLKKG